MPRAEIEFHPDAIFEAKSAHEWYATRSEQAAVAFMAELDRAVGAISEGPDRWPSYLHGTRRFLMRRFPFLVVYRKIPTGFEIVAVAHAKRRPGYWKSR